jgi:hypothetical protein
MRLPATLEERLAELRPSLSASPSVQRIAFDRSARTYDPDGRLRVRSAIVTRSCVNRYYGYEIPTAEDLGLDPQKSYKLLRPAAELQKAVDGFNNLPLLSRHVPVSSDDHRPDLVIGATGSDAAFDGENLTCSLIVWAQNAIDDVEDGSARSLSAGYRYTPVMKPGSTPQGPYDGYMSEIIPNHIAVVDEPRVTGAMIGDQANKRNHYLGKFTHDMSEATATGGIDALLEFLKGKLSPEDIEEVRTMMGGEDPVMAGDDPPEFSGMPRTGGTMAEITKNLAQDAINRAKAKQVDDFYRRHPGAMRLRNAR